VLSGAQAGLSWSIVLKKRGKVIVARSTNLIRRKSRRYSEKQIQNLTSDPEIIRNRMKIEARCATRAHFSDPGGVREVSIPIAGVLSRTSQAQPMEDDAADSCDFP